MRRPFPRHRLLIWWAAVALVLAVFVRAPSARAQSTECLAVDQREMPRACTFLEEHGMCLTNALDSYDQCVKDADTFYDRTVCELGVQVDLFACNIMLPWTLLKPILR